MTEQLEIYCNNYVQCRENIKCFDRGVLITFDGIKQEMNTLTGWQLAADAELCSNTVILTINP